MSIRSFRFGLALLVLAAGMAPAARAATLSTPLFSAGTDYLVCTATNVGTKPAEVTVEATDISGNPRTFDISTCGATLPPRASCYARLEVGEDAACFFTHRGTIKAMIQLFDTVDGVVSSVPATR